MNFERTQPKVSIVIASWFTPEQNGKYGDNETFWFATKCLKKLLENTPRDLFELILINNGSKSIGFKQWADKMWKEEKIEATDVRWPSYDERGYWSEADVLIRHRENLGFGPGYNTGFALARGEYVICMNNDVVVYPGWLDAMLEAFEVPQTPPVGVVMPALVKGLKDAHEALELDKPDLTSNRDMYGPNAEFGSLWMIKRELLEGLKAKDGYYFDENFILGMGEDRDLWKRVRREGFETYRTHNTRVFHQGNMTISKIKDRKEYTAKNREYLKKKWNIKDDSYK